LRVFLDTNIIVSAFTTRGLCADLFREILAAHTLVTSDYILSETQVVLTRRFKVPEDTVIEIIALLRKQEITIPPATSPQIAIRDLDDLPVLAAAIESKADYLVSGDKDITSLFPLKEIKIATPGEFWTVISKIHPI
jgi:putative PIN family toxin of toxin-antitoxin system